MTTHMRRMTISLPAPVAADLAYLAYRFGKPKSELLRELLGDTLAQMRTILAAIPTPLDELTPEERSAYLLECSALLQAAVDDARDGADVLADAARGSAGGQG